MRHHYPLIGSLVFISALFSCSSNQTSYIPTDTQADAVSEAKDLFKGSPVTVQNKLVDCTLSGGTKTQCLSITINPTSASHDFGPWCPRNISEGADKSGIWLDSGNVYDVDGQFIEHLAEFYSDDQWQLFDAETGAIRVTDSKEACLAAARPDVDAKYTNYCVECLPAYLEDQKAFTYLIPAEPVHLKSNQRINPHGGVGLAFSGVKFDAPAPVDAILGAHTLAPFDDCGGHVNPHVGYHYHAATACASEKESVVGHAPMIGFALDGYKLHSQLNADGKEPSDLDSCRGHEYADLGYHYHVNNAGKNQILGCFRAEQGCAIEQGRESCEHGDRRPPPRARE